MLATGDLSKTISLRPSKPDWNGLHGRIESGKIEYHQLLDKCDCEGEWRAKSSDGEKNMEPIDFICLFLCRNHWKKL